MSQDHPGYANLANLKLLEGLYENWLKNPISVDPSWQNFFEGMQFASTLPKALPPRQESSDLRIHLLINAYRKFGHLWATTNPLISERGSMPDELKGENFGFTEEDKGKEFPTGGILDKEKAPLSEIVEALQKTYCGSVGIEYMDLGSPQIEKWIQERIEPGFPTHLDKERRVEILKQLNRAEEFETFLHRKYVGQKRFSLEGAETFIPALHALLHQGGERGVTDLILGMAHRGRLNVLANIMGKSYEYIFEEFEAHFIPDLSESTGDVKYHMGFGGTYETKENKTIQLILVANPSHLESVDPVLEGCVRALQEQRRNKNDPQSIVPLLVHGDSSLSGQGVVYETMTLKNLNGYGTKGTIHIVINNQIGFTTLPKDSRSTRYCTEIAKAFSAPVFHVNGEDPEGCVRAAQLALELRQEFGSDVFLDIIGYRKYGHNEGDEPTFTQPGQYEIIHKKKSIRELYKERLLQEGTLTQEEANAFEEEFKQTLTKTLEGVKSKKQEEKQKSLRQKGKHLPQLLAPFETKIPKDTLLNLGKKLTQPPPDFNLHSKIQRFLKEREEMLSQDPNTPSIDWGMGELLAYATLCAQGIHIRISGEDVRRGTFSHRHAAYVDQLTGHSYFPLSHLSEDQAPFDVFNSPLSEFGVLGFEWGYSLFYPRSLVIWEAQYGDFANGAQVIIDQYIAASEMKWGQLTNLTLLLPHGYEGGGPEHSSARIERYLQLCGDENMIVANCTLPHQLFHLLRRQALRELRKPLIVFTPKVLLRYPACRSPLNAFSEGSFEEILDDPTPPQNPKRLLLCSGKFYYELIAEREKKKAQDLIIRIEQLYPLHTEKLKKLFNKYQGIKKCIWVQEEPQNMGPWNYIKPHLETLLEGKIPLSYIGRKESASTAAGSHALYKLEHEALINELLPEGPTP